MMMMVTQIPRLKARTFPRTACRAGPAVAYQGAARLVGAISAQPRASFTWLQRTAGLGSPGLLQGPGPERKRAWGIGVYLPEGRPSTTVPVSRRDEPQPDCLGKSAADQPCRAVCRVQWQRGDWYRRLGGTRGNEHVHDVLGGQLLRPESVLLGGWPEHDHRPHVPVCRLFQLQPSGLGTQVGDRGVQRERYGSLLLAGRDWAVP